MGLNLEQGMTVFLDTAPFIYLIEGHGAFSAPVRTLIDECLRLQVRILTSLITYIEVLTLPERLGRSDLTAQYRMFLTNSENLSIYPINIQVADECIRLRARYGFKTPDAIQLAVAQVCGADVVLTNDAEWKKCREVSVQLVSDL